MKFLGTTCIYWHNM